MIDTHSPTVKIHALRTRKGIGLDNTLTKLIVRYGQPLFKDDFIIFQTPGDHQQYRFIDTTNTMKGVFTVQYNKKTRRVTYLQVHYGDW